MRKKERGGKRMWRAQEKGRSGCVQGEARKSGGLVNPFFLLFPEGRVLMAQRKN